MGVHVQYMCACIHLSEHPAPLPFWPQHSCINTHPATHPLTSECVSDMVCVCVSIFWLWTKAESRQSPEKPGRKDGGRWREREIHIKGERGQSSEKVEWDIWKRERESHWDKEEIAAAQQWFIGENSFLHLPLLPLVLHPLYLTLSPLSMHYSPLWMTDNHVKKAF